MDSQAIAKALKNQRSQSGHYLLDAIHLAAEHLQAKQDSLINGDERRQILAKGGRWKGKTKDVIDLQIHWVPGHCDFEPNECANEEAKSAAQGSSSDPRFLPHLLCKKLPLSISALRQENSNKLKRRWQ
jgi:ribonuclease HI